MFAQFDAAMEEHQSLPYLIALINVDKGKIDLNKLRKMANKPALILAIDKGSVVKGEISDYFVKKAKKELKDP